MSIGEIIKKFACDYIDSLEESGNYNLEELEDKVIKAIQEYIDKNYVAKSKIPTVTKDEIVAFKELTNICDTAPYPKCNGANGCDTCEHQEEDEILAVTLFKIWKTKGEVPTPGQMWEAIRELNE